MLVEVLSGLAIVALMMYVMGLVLLVNPGGRRREINPLAAAEILYGGFAAYLWLRSAVCVLTGDRYGAFAYTVAASVMTILWWFFRRMRKDRLLIPERAGYKLRAVLAKISARMRQTQPRSRKLRPT